MRKRTPFCRSSWPLAFQCGDGAAEAISFALQFRYDSPCIQGVLLWFGCSFADYKPARIEIRTEQAQHGLTSGRVLRLLFVLREPTPVEPCPAA
jgi:hypothetical protein